DCSIDFRAGVLGCFCPTRLLGRNHRGELLSRPTMSFGVPAGATMPCHACQSYPDTVVAIGGTSATSIVGVAADVPSGTTFPAWMFGTAIVASQNMMWMLPVKRSVRAAGVPLYGTCWMSSQ